jgi:hypothetical protein
MESGATYVRGPEVRTQTIRTAPKDGPAETLVELHRFGGTVCDAEGAPVAGAWVALPASGRWTASDAAGRFRLDRVAPGEHRVVVRTAAGAEAEADVRVPGGRADLVVGTGQRRRTKR